MIKIFSRYIKVLLNNLCIFKITVKDKVQLLLAILEIDFTEESVEGTAAAEGIAGDLVTLVEERVTEEIVEEMPAEGIIGGTAADEITKEVTVEEIVVDTVAEEIAEEIAVEETGRDAPTGGEATRGRGRGRGRRGSGIARQSQPALAGWQGGRETRTPTQAAHTQDPELQAYREERANLGQGAHERRLAGQL